MATVLTPMTQLFAARSIRLGALTVLTISMLVTLGWEVSHFFRGFTSQTPVAAVQTGETTLPDTKNKLSSSLLSLFGAKNPDTDLAAKTTEKLPESNLNLQVSAIFFMARAAQSSVILEDGDRTMILKPGEEARPGIVLQAIETHRITLKRNGKLEQISFKGFGEMPGANTPANTLPSTPELSVTPEISQNNDSEVVAQIPVDIPSAEPAAVEQNTPTAYQQYIQRKIAQNK